MTPPTASDDAMGLGYTSDTICALEQNKNGRFGEHRTARLVLAAWDRLATGAESQCSPAFT